jgi:hypothetical protein
MPISAGVVSVAQPSAVIALRYMTAKEFGSAVLDVAKRTLLTGGSNVWQPR